jgi:hypothetical protein
LKVATMNEWEDTPLFFDKFCFSIEWAAVDWEKPLG